MASSTVRTVCPHDCPDLCSILATVEDGRLISVAGDPDHPITRGFLCGKVAHYEERVHSPDRLLTPLRRVGPKGAGDFAPVTWDQALDEIAARWRAVIAAHGAEALLGYAYSGHMGLVNRHAAFRPLFHALGASRFVHGTVCDSTCAVGWEYAVGDTPGTDPETIVDSDLILCWGANLVTTNVHIIPVIEQARARGAQLVVVDPYRSRTARRADWHVAPRVGTDTALALGIMHVIVREGLHDAAYLVTKSVGFAELRDQVLPAFTPERVADITGVSAADLERLAGLVGRARAPFLRLGMAPSRHINGGMAIRTIACLPGLVGAWDRPGGGAMMDTAGIWGFDNDALRRPDLAPVETREINHSQLGRALLELDAPPVKALFVASNNPAVSCPDNARVVAGLAREDLFTVVHDVFLTDTARFADLVLPACTAVETEDLYRSYGTYYVQYGPQLIEPLGESRSNLWLSQTLAQRMGLADPHFCRTPRQHMAAALAGASGPTADLDLDRLLAGGAFKLPYRHGGPEYTYFLNPGMADDGLPTLPTWTPDPVEAVEGARWPLRLLTVPGHFQHHTAFDAVARLRQREGDPQCLLHPDDATPRSIADGDAIALFNDRGHVGLRTRVTTDAPAGTVVVPGQRSRGRYLSGGPINVLTSDRLTDMGAGATYQSTWLDAARLEAWLAGRPSTAGVAAS